MIRLSNAFTLVFIRRGCVRHRCAGLAATRKLHTVPVAYMFPGQGTQTVGMGRDLAEQYPDAARVFAEVDDALQQPLSRLMFEGDPVSLSLLLWDHR
jgi:acyl transferase domain-containing protein